MTDDETFTCLDCGAVRRPENEREPHAADCRFREDGD